MTFDALIAALPDLPASVRVHGWLRAVQHALTATPAQLAALDTALATWPARSRAAWGAWYAAVDQVEQTGPWEQGYDVFRSLIEPTSPAFALARHVGLWFDHGVGVDAIDRFSSWPSLRTITSVSLQTSYSADQGRAIDRFVRAPATQHLRELTLGLAGIDAELVASILVGSPEKVERVWIHDVRHEARFAELLADWIDTRTDLIGLSLHACPLGTAGLGQLGERGSFDRLTELTLRGVTLDDEAAARWAIHRSPGRLRMLDLEEQFFDGNHAMQGPGLIALAEAGWLDHLESLALSYHRLTADSLAHVLDRADLSQLRHLRLHCTGFDASDAERLRHVKAAKLPALEHLELAYTQLSDAAASELADAFMSSRVRQWLR
jgi:hypothetical protein